MNSSNGKNAKERLNILAGSNDGFYIASEDLKMRGPGDFFGVRQSGLMEFKIADDLFGCRYAFYCIRRSKRICRKV